MNTITRRRSLGFFLPFLLCPSLGWASEMSSMWANIYRRAESLEQRSVIMDRIIAQEDQDLIPLLIQSQSDLLQVAGDSLSLRERHYFRVLQRKIVRELGDLRAVEAGAVLYRTLEEAKSNFLKAETIASLGRIGATEYAEILAKILYNINMEITFFPTKEEKETVAAACITALARMRDPVGFSPVFFSAVGGYTSKVVRMALHSLYSMVDDPSARLGEILVDIEDFDMKNKVLDINYFSSASGEEKIRVAVIGLSEGLRHVPGNIREMTALSRLRTGAARILGEFGYEDPVIAAELERMLKLARTETKDLNEILTCLQALGAGRGTAPVQVLTTHLKKLNDLQRSGITITDQREITQTIRSLGKTGNPLARGELIQVEFSHWNEAVKREAKEALANL